MNVVGREAILAQNIVEHDARLGYYKVRLFQFGQWVEVVVDDLFPGKFHTATSPSNILASVIEKAHAKLFGCYENLTGGSIAGGITDLTGGMVERVVLRERGSAVMDEQALHDLLTSVMAEVRSADPQQAYRVRLGAVRQANGGNPTMELNEAWVVSDVEETGNGSLAVRLERPFTVGFQGATDITLGLRELLETATKLYVLRVPIARQVLSEEEEEAHAAAVAAAEEAGQDPPAKRLGGVVERSIKSRWNSALSGGSFASHPDTWLSNPQFKLVAAEPNTTLTIHLEQEDPRTRGHYKVERAIGLYLLSNRENEGARREKPDPESEMVFDENLIYSHSEPLLDKRDVVLTVTLRDPGEYLVIPTTGEPGQRGRFLLRAASSSEFELEPLDEANTVLETPTLEELSGKLKAREQKYVDPAFEGARALYGTYRPASAEAMIWDAVPGGVVWRRPKDILTPPPPPPPTEEELRARELAAAEKAAREAEEDDDDDDPRSRKGAAAGKKKKKGRDDDDDDDDAAPSSRRKKAGGGKGGKRQAPVESDPEDDEDGEPQAPVIPDPVLFPAAPEGSGGEDGPAVRFGDVVQGDVDDCYFVGALGVLAAKPDLLRSLVVSSDFELGAHEFRFFRANRWHTVVVDDLIPCRGDTGMPIFARSRSEVEFWPALLEKAYAKFNGCYLNLEAGSLAEALAEVTGWVSSQEMSRDADELWERLTSYHAKGYLLGCADPGAHHPADAASADGILKNHAYGIVDVRDSHGNLLIRLRNPWGVKDWAGPFADHSKDWSKKILKDLDYQFDSGDGTFWMPLESFLAEFSELYVTRNYSTEEPEEDGTLWVRKEVPGTFDFKYSGGYADEPTLLRNPQYHLMATEPNQEVLISIEQEDHRPLGLHDPDACVGFLLLENVKRLPDPDDENPPDEIPEPRRLEKEDKRVNRRLAGGVVAQRVFSARATLQPNQDYVIVAQSNRGRIMPFTITVQSKQDVALEFLKGDAKPVRPLLEKRRVVELAAKWTLKKAGGSPSYDTWKNNPQFLLTVPRRTPLSIDLEQVDREGRPVPEDSVDLHSAGFVVVRSRRAEKVTTFDKASVRGVCELEHANFVTVDLEFEESVNYVIVPFTREPGRLGNFVLRVLCHEEVSLERIDKEHLVDTTQNGPRRSNFTLDDVTFIKQDLAQVISKPIQRTLVILKPDALSLGSAEVILSMIEDQPGMTILQHQIVELNVEQVREFAPLESDAVIEFLASGPIMALVVMGPGVVSEFQLLAGDPDPGKALMHPDNSPATIRAMFGTDPVRNAVYCSDTEAGARRDIKFFFPDMVIEPLPEILDVQRFLSQSVYPALIEALTQLCKSKPADPKLWLGNWLIDNNPTKPTVSEAHSSSTTRTSLKAITSEAYTVEEPDS